MNRIDKRKCQKNICPLASSARKRAASDNLAATVKDRLPAGLAQPALRALAAAGRTDLDQLAMVTEADLAEFHGLGPKAIEINHKSRESPGKSFLR